MIRSNVYVAAGTDGWLSLLEAPRAGGPAVELFAVTTNGSAVYVATSNGIYKIGSGGGTRVTPDGTSELLADATNLYWLGAGTSGAALKKVPAP